MSVTMNESRIIFLESVQCVRIVCSFDIKMMYTRNEGWLYSFRIKWASSGAHPPESMWIEFFNLDIDVHFTMHIHASFPCYGHLNAEIWILVTCWQNIHLLLVGKERVYSVCPLPMYRYTSYQCHNRRTLELWILAMVMCEDGNEWRVSRLGGGDHLRNPFMITTMGRRGRGQRGQLTECWPHLYLRKME